MNQEIITKKSLNDPMIRGLEKMAGIVKRTLGPGGLPILIERRGQALDGTPLAPKITKDGVSVAEECYSQDKKEDVVIQTVKSVCKKTNQDAGDGTTTAIVLGEALVKTTIEILNENQDLNPQLVKESIENAVQDVLETLKSMTLPIDDFGLVKQVATISANGDEEVGDIISRAFEKVGAEGVVTVDMGTTNAVELNVVDGYQFNRGAESRQNFFNNKSLTHFEAEECEVIIYDGNLYNYTDLIPALQVLARVDAEGKPTRKFPPLMIIANEFSNEVITFLIMQKQQGGMPVVPVRGPHMTHVRSGYYDDLAYYLGATRLGNGNKSLTAIEQDDFGLAGRVIVDKYKTTIYDGYGDENELLQRVDQLKDLKDVAESPYDASIINDRIAALTSGVAKIGVGGLTELEIKEKYDRIEDALNAARAAIQEGIVPGGGVALLRAANQLDPNQSIGHGILQTALQAPFKQILENIGEGESDIDDLATAVLENDDCIYDARNKKIVNFLEAGIIDPVKVTKSALGNAISIATLLATAGGAIIFELPKK